MRRKEAREILNAATPVLAGAAHALQATLREKERETQGLAERIIGLLGNLRSEVHQEQDEIRGQVAQALGEFRSVREVLGNEAARLVEEVREQSRALIRVSGQAGGAGPGPPSDAGWRSPRSLTPPKTASAEDSEPEARNGRSALGGVHSEGDGRAGLTTPRSVGSDDVRRKIRKWSPSQHP